MGTRQLGRTVGSTLLLPPSPRHAASWHQAHMFQGGLPPLQVSFGVFDSEEGAARQYDRALILEKAGRAGCLGYVLWLLTLPGGAGVGGAGWRGWGGGRGSFCRGDHPARHAALPPSNSGTPQFAGPIRRGLALGMLLCRAGLPRPTSPLATTRLRSQPMRGT